MIPKKDGKFRYLGIPKRSRGGEAVRSLRNWRDWLSGRALVAHGLPVPGCNPARAIDVGSGGFCGVDVQDPMWIAVVADRQIEVVGGLRSVWVAHGRM